MNVEVAPTQLASKALVIGLTAALLSACGGGGSSATTQSSVGIGLNLTLSGANAANGTNILNGANLAIDEINAKGGAGGNIKINAIVKNDATVSAGGTDAAQAVTNLKALAANSSVMAVLGPQSSTAGKAMSPVASDANLALLTPTATNPDITDPQFKDKYRPAGKAIFFRMVTTDAYQGPNMANEAQEKLGVKSVYVFDDGTAYGTGTAKAFLERAKAKGLTIQGPDTLDPAQSDYRSALTRAAASHPDAIYYGGTLDGGVKFAQQAFQIMPNVIKLAGDGLYLSNFPSTAGQAAEGWIVTVAAPNTIAEPAAQQWVSKYQTRYHSAPTVYAIVAYDAIYVLADAINRAAKASGGLTRENVRASLETTSLDTLQGHISFDNNGDLQAKVVSLFKVQGGDFVYIGTAPQD